MTEMELSTCSYCDDRYPRYLMLDNGTCKICLLAKDTRSSIESVFKETTASIESLKLTLDAFIGRFNELELNKNDLALKELKENVEIVKVKVNDVEEKMIDMNTSSLDWSGFVPGESEKTRKDRISEWTTVNLKKVRKNIQTTPETKDYCPRVHKCTSEESEICAGNLNEHLSVGTANLKLSNQFEVLEESGDDSHLSSYTIVGDSMVKYCKNHCYREGKRIKRMVHSSSGAGVAEIIEHLDNSSELEGDTVIIHAGTNDVNKTGSEKRINLFREAINRVRAKGKKCIISGIIPRKYESRYWLSKAIGQNSRIMQLCKEMDGCFFVDTWFDFWQNDQLFSRDGIHLSRKGERFLSKRLDEAVVYLSNLEQHLLSKDKR